MPYVSELFGYSLGESGERGKDCRQALCPHMGKLCDGGGNRDMARWRATEQPLAPLFDASVGENGDGYIPCGVCSISLSRGGQSSDSIDWAVCPRRLLTFEGTGFSDSQRPLGEKVLGLAGFQAGDKIQVWSEITLSDRAKNFRYRLDYVLRKDDKPPVIVEIMTASTSGGNRQKRTDIQSAFCDAVLYANGLQEQRGNSPGVNARQVWARMASQMIVKSQVANAWGGSAIWVVQDSLMDYIKGNTGLRLDELRSLNWQPKEVNVVSANINDPDDLKLFAGPVQSKNGEACWSELLNAPGIPELEKLTNRLEDHAPIATLSL